MFSLAYVAKNLAVNVAVALEISGKGHPIFLKMEVILDCKGVTLNDFAHENIAKGTVIHCDTYSSYGALKQDYHLEQEVYSETKNTEFLKYLQEYLNEFCYRFNRRHNPKPVLNHLLECCVWADYKSATELAI